MEHMDLWKPSSCEVDQISYNATISSCQRATEWRAALAILKDMSMEMLGDVHGIMGV